MPNYCPQQPLNHVPHFRRQRMTSSCLTDHQALHWGAIRWKVQPHLIGLSLLSRRSLNKRLLNSLNPFICLQICREIAQLNFLRVKSCWCHMTAVLWSSAEGRRKTQQIVQQQQKKQRKRPKATRNPKVKVLGCRDTGCCNHPAHKTHSKLLWHEV